MKKRWSVGYWANVGSEHEWWLEDRRYFWYGSAALRLQGWKQAGIFGYELRDLRGQPTEG